MKVLQLLFLILDYSDAYLSTTSRQFPSFRKRSKRAGIRTVTCSFVLQICGQLFKPLVPILFTLGRLMVQHLQFSQLARLEQFNSIRKPTKGRRSTNTTWKLTSP